MKFHHVTIDEFLERPDAVREWAMAQEFKTEISPADGLEYPGILTPLPDFLLKEVWLKLSTTFGETVEHVLSFMRLTVEGYMPHAWIHSDPRIADWIAVTYMNPDCGTHKCWWGTGMYEHKRTNLVRSPRTMEEHKVWAEDCQFELAWRLVGFVHGKYNRTVIFNTHTLHAAHPEKGYGTGIEDGRLVMVNFFNLRVREDWAFAPVEEAVCAQPQPQQLELPLPPLPPSALR